MPNSKAVEGTLSLTPAATVSGATVGRIELFVDGKRSGEFPPGGAIPLRSDAELQSRRGDAVADAGGNGFRGDGRANRTIRRRQTIGRVPAGWRHPAPIGCRTPKPSRGRCR